MAPFPVNVSQVNDFEVATTVSLLIVTVLVSPDSPIVIALDVVVPVNTLLNTFPPVEFKVNVLFAAKVTEPFDVTGGFIVNVSPPVFPIDIVAGLTLEENKETDWVVVDP